MLDGAARIGDLVEEVARQEMPAIAMTDHGNVFGAFDFYKQAVKAGVKPIIGIEAYVAPESRFDKKKVQWADGGDDDVSDADEEIVEKCLEVIRQEKKASTSLLQRRLRLGYTRAARMMDILEQRGIIGPGEGAKPREILINVGQDEA